MPVKAYLEWSQATPTASFSNAIDRLPIEDRIAGRIALDQIQNQPWLGLHFVTKQKLEISNDNRRLYYGRTIVGLYAFSWVAETLLSQPIIIEISTQLHGSINFAGHLLGDRFPRLHPCIWIASKKT